jgi:tetratricopeptide (TPR) repeat protein
MRRLILIIALMVGGMAAAAVAADNPGDPLSLFIKAGFAYKDGQYEEAAKIYEQVLASGVESGPLYFNLANSYFKQNKLGPAILNYERARRLLPRDSDVAANYTFALNAAQVTAMPPQNSLILLFNQHIRFYTVSEMIVIITSLFFAGLFLFLWSLQRTWPVRRRILVLGLIGLLAIIHVIGLAASVEARKNTAVIVAASDALFEPREKATVYFSLPEGSSVHIISREGLWTKVRRPDGKIGWVPAQAVAEI